MVITEIKILFATLILCIALFNAVTKGEMKWSIVAYWVAVSAYWAVVRFW